MKHFLLLIGLALAFSGTAQLAPNKYWVQFTDKDNTPYSLDAPEDFLTQRSIQRRIQQQIQLNETDLPVDPAYVQAVAELENVQLIHRSKWFNSVTIYSEDTLISDQLEQLPFVAQVRNVEVVKGYYGEFALSREENSLQEFKDAYGQGFHQIDQINGLPLHVNGYHGEGMQIAVLDAGFAHVDHLPVFDKLRAEGRILGMHDFVDGDGYIYHHNHGMYVLSTMAGYLPDSLIGTAYEASYYLYRTEDGSSETLLEEDNWAVAAERADSLGVDMINSSLGYSTFDDPDQDHSYADMDGNTTIITRAADLAASKGILVVTSAGNSGASPWHYITAPADADSVLTAGAIDSNGEHAFFSSFGPTADDRVKPDVVTLGLGSAFANTDSTIRTGNGTSFSSPILCGMTACLWQAHPEKKNMEIISAIQQSASLFSNPNDSLGYGIPDFWIADKLLLGSSDNETESLTIYPNPTQGAIQLEWTAQSDAIPTLQIFDLQGRLVHDAVCGYVNRGVGIIQLDVRNLDLAAGKYLVQLIQDEKIYVQKLLVSSVPE